MADRPYKPGPSKIHGLGVIATRFIRAGACVSVTLDDSYRGFNHSCEPTLGRLYLAPHRGNRRFALCDIPSGSELTVDYRAWNGRPNQRLEFICNCPKCRKETA